MTKSRGKYRVIQWSTGQTGQHSLRGILDHPQLELAGLWCHNDANEGRDAGDLCGRPKTGVVATQDVDALLSLDGDCVCYMSTDMMRPLPELVEELGKLLASGLNVVGPQTSLGFPLGIDKELLDVLTGACERGASSLYISGLSPDANLVLMTNVASVCHRVESVSVAEMLTMNHYNEPFVLAGIGLGVAPSEETYELMYEHLWTPLIKHLAHDFGVELDSGYLHRHETLIADERVELPGSVVEPGTVTAAHHSMSGLIDGTARITTHGYYWAGEYPDVWPSLPGEGGYRIEIAGNPGITLDYCFSHEENVTVAVLVATAMRPVNAIPTVCNAAPGLLTLLDLPVVMPSTNWNSR